MQAERALSRGPAQQPAPETARFDDRERSSPVRPGRVSTEKNGQPPTRAAFEQRFAISELRSQWDRRRISCWSDQAGVLVFVISRAPHRLDNVAKPGEDPVLDQRRLLPVESGPSRPLLLAAAAGALTYGRGEGPGGSATT